MPPTFNHMVDRWRTTLKSATKREYIKKHATDITGESDMGIRKVKEYFRQYGMEHRIQEFEESSATVELAAKALHCEPCRIAKTLSFMVGEQPVLIVAAVCPFAVNENVTVYLDESLKRFQTVFPACDSNNSAIELTIDELERYSRFAAWIDVCKGWNENQEQNRNA